MQGRGIVLARARARARAQVGLLAACAVLLLVGSAALSGLVTHASIASTQGVRQRLLDLPASERLLQVSSASAAEGISADALENPTADDRDAAVAEHVARTLGAAGIRHDVHVSGRTGLVPVSGAAAESPAGPPSRPPGRCD